MWDTIVNFTLNRNVQLYGYFLPLSIAFVSLSIEYISNYIKEKKEYENAVRNKKSFHPSLTIGNMVGGYVVSAIPIINFLYCCFGVIPDMVSYILNKANRALNINLVPSYTPPEDEIRKGRSNAN